MHSVTWTVWPCIEPGQEAAMQGGLPAPRLSHIWAAWHENVSGDFPLKGSFACEKQANISI